MRKFLLEKHTYDRWINYGTLYGMSSESLVILTTPFHEQFSKLLAIHTQTIYYQMAIICLAQRATMLRVQSEVTEIKDLVNTKNHDDTIIILKSISELYQNYIEFINKLYFREITSQIQGIEMYSKMQDVMNIHRDIKDLDGEIEELHTYSSMIEQKIIVDQQTQFAKKQSNLNKIAFIFLPSTLLAGILGMNVFDGENALYLSNNTIDWYPIFYVGLVILIAIIISVCSFWENLKKCFKK